MNTSKSFRNGLILKDKGKFKKNLIINIGGLHLDYLRGTLRS